MIWVSSPAWYIGKALPYVRVYAYTCYININKQQVTAAATMHNMTCNYTTSALIRSRVLLLLPLFGCCTCLMPANGEYVPIRQNFKSILQQQKSLRYQTKPFERVFLRVARFSKNWWPVPAINVVTINSWTLSHKIDIGAPCSVGSPEFSSRTRCMLGGRIWSNLRRPKMSLFRTCEDHTCQDRSSWGLAYTSYLCHHVLSLFYVCHHILISLLH